jgi:hypothetical protein
MQPHVAPVPPRAEKCLPAELCWNNSGIVSLHAAVSRRSAL